MRLTFYFYVETKIVIHIIWSSLFFSGSMTGRYITVIKKMSKIDISPQQYMSPEWSDSSLKRSFFDIYSNEKVISNFRLIKDIALKSNKHKFHSWKSINYF